MYLLHLHNVATDERWAMAFTSRARRIAAAVVFNRVPDLVLSTEDV